MGQKINEYKSLIGKPDGNTQFGISYCRWENYIEKGATDYD
jgi:hypothetical protein